MQLNKLTVMKKMANIHFTSENASRSEIVTKSKLSLLNDKHKRGGYFLCFVKVSCPWVFFSAYFFQSFFLDACSAFW